MNALKTTFRGSRGERPDAAYCKLKPTHQRDLHSSVLRFESPLNNPADY